MRTVILPSTRDSQPKSTFSSGPGAPIFETNGALTRIYRAPVRAIACMKVEGREIWGQVLDVGPGGCAFKTESTLSEGSAVEMRVTIIGPENRSVAEVTGVIRRAGEQDGRKCYGIEFHAADTEERNALQWLYGQALSA